MTMTIALVVIVSEKKIENAGGYNVPWSKGVICTVHDYPQKKKKGRYQFIAVLSTKHDYLYKCLLHQDFLVQEGRD